MPLVEDKNTGMWKCIAEWAKDDFDDGNGDVDAAKLALTLSHAPKDYMYLLRKLSDCNAIQPEDVVAYIATKKAYTIVMDAWSLDADFILMHAKAGNIRALGMRLAFD